MSAEDQPADTRADSSEPVIPADLFEPGSGFDPERWVRDAEGRIGYLGANAHTFRGRFLTFWVHLGAAYSTSLHELRECSQASAHWLSGFLSGSEPPPPDHRDEREPDFEQWRDAVAMYGATGAWKAGRICEVCGNEMLPSAPVGLRCELHAEPANAWPTIT